MKILFILKLIIIITRRGSAQNNNFDVENVNLGNEFHQLPQNYSLKVAFEIDHPAYSITYSPDENWFVYRTSQASFSNRVFFRNRSSYSQEKSIKIGLSQKIEKINCFVFSQSGDLLFVITEDTNLFVCKFSSDMKDEDCQKSYQFGVSNSIPIMLATNSLDKIVVQFPKNYNWTLELWVFNFTSDGNLTMEFHIELENANSVTTLWHPKAQTDTLIASGCNRTQQDGFIAILNITSNSISTLNTECIWEGFMLKDGQTYMTKQHTSIIQWMQYRLDRNFATKIGPINTKAFTFIKASQDGKTLVGRQFPSRLVVYQISQRQIQLQRLISKDAQTPIINLYELFYIKCDDSVLISSDVNEILINLPEQHLINEYSLCPNFTYFTNLQCLYCSSPCKTCHINSENCFDCIDNTYALANGTCLKCNILLIGCQTCLNYICLHCVDDRYVLTNGSCLNCNKFITGCLSCPNSSYCQTCDTSAGFVETPVNGLCQCSDFNYVKEGYCVLCDAKSICKKCSSPTNCLICNKINFWQETPINGTCVCQDFYFNASSTCTLCDSLRVCKTCDNSSYCTKCDISKGFLEDPVNGNCVCPANFTYNSGNCIKCLVQGCISCIMENYCNFCDQNFSILEGKCVNKSKSMVFIFVGIGLAVFLIGLLIFCKCRKYKKKKVEESLLISVQDEETIEDKKMQCQK